jgi:putative membrane-bound dehydrogenase-like protein
LPKVTNVKHTVLAVVWLLLAASRCIAAPAENTTQVELNGHTFTLPAGFEIEVAAASPFVERPITADFDEQGRLYVSDSSGSNDNVQKQLEEKPHRVVRLEDTDGDGRFDRSTVFADKLMFPEGTMWYDGSLYVAAPPSIWKLTDTDGDGVADQREEWFQGKTLTGCANDLHGPYLGPDGWIYWCKGAFAEQTYERDGRPPLVTKASHIFRCRPDGSQIEPVMTGGMDNPVDVVFTPGGERIFTTTFLVHPGGGLRDGLIHAVYGGVYGKLHAVLDGHPRTSPDVMPVLSHLGPAAPCGLTRYESDVFGKEYQDSLFAALFNMQKVTRHVLTPDGATFASRDEDFVVSNNRDFHPTDVLEDADGSLLIVDTGGWYKLCCPTSQLVKADVLGAIYRVRRRGAARIDDPWGLSLGPIRQPKASILFLADRLGDERPRMRWRAVEGLAALGDKAVPVLNFTNVVGKARHTPEHVRRSVNAIWALTRIGTPSARLALNYTLSNPDETVRQAAIHAVSVLRDRRALPKLIELLSAESQQNRRAAAEAIGQLGSARAVDALLAAIEKLPASPTTSADRVLEHSLIYALIEIGAREKTLLGLASTNPVVQRAALVALDQMPEGGLTAATVTPFLAAGDGELRRTAGWIVGRHPEWADALADHLAQRLGDAALSADDREELANQLGAFAGSTSIQQLLAARLSDKGASAAERRVVLAALARSGLKETPATWITGMAQIVRSADPALRGDVVAAIRALPIAKAAAGPLLEALSPLAMSETLDEADRLMLLAAVPGGLDAVPPATFDLLLAQIDPGKAVSFRAAAVETLSKAKLTADQLAALATRLPSAGPLEVDRLLSSFEQSTDAEIGLKLLAALNDPALLPLLRVETLKPHLAKYPADVQTKAERLYARLTAGIAAQRAKLDELAESLPTGDVRRGQAIFNSTKAACVTCHTIGYLGGRLGPDLTRIGQIRNSRDLLESIVLPSASFVRSYEPVTVVTATGLVHNGLLRKDATDEVVLVKSATEEIHIAREEVDEMRPGTVSIMPQGLDKQLTAQELADLVAFLQGCK